MGFENLFFKKEQTQNAKDSDDELDEKALSRRNFLRGAGAVAIASAIPWSESLADEYLEDAIRTPEDRERNVEKIRAYEDYLTAIEGRFYEPGLSKQEFTDLLYGYDGIPAISRSVLEGTELDREEFFRANDSWPAVQLRRVNYDDRFRYRFAHGTNSEDGTLTGYANSFFLGDTLISNRHAFDKSDICEVIEDKHDIAGCSLDDFNAGEDFRKGPERVALEWDRRKVSENLHGKLVHIPSIHEQRGSGPDDTDITSGVLFKLTPSVVESFDLSPQFAHFKEQLLNSYACVVPPQDNNEDGISNDLDVRGTSGSPVFTDVDCEMENTVPSGIVWGGLAVRDRRRGVTYTLMLIHGPETIGEMIDTIDTILSPELTEADVPNKRELTTKVQSALVAYGYKNLPIDGLYGNNTAAVIQAFQEREFDEDMRARSIIPGVMDRRTWEALFPNEEDPNKKVLWGVQ